MAVRLRMRWRVVSLFSERLVRALVAIFAVAPFCAASHATEPQPLPVSVSAASHTTASQRQLAAAPTGIANPTPAVSQSPLVYFNWFQYHGNDAVFEQPAPQGSYRNPVLPGFYPDPSITRVGDTFYLVNSTFTYFPGIPVFSSQDLVHWRQIGNVIERPRELNFDNKEVSRGIFAPTIRFHNGLFYLITTAVDSGGNAVFVARNPAGPWSDPIFLTGLEGGIDPSLFFDDNGKAYVVNNGLPAGGPKYEGHRAIWIQEFAVPTRKLIGPRKMLINGGVDISKKPIWIEGPHLYRHDGWYILMCAEGGTSLQHSEVVFRARSPWGPFKPFNGNPILTQRDLPADRANPVINVGHADLVEVPGGQWWAVFLGSRAYQGVHYNTGRETYMLPVTWRDGWPIILPPGKPIPYVVEAPKFAAATPAPNAASATTSATAATTSQAPATGGSLPTTGNFTLQDDFNAPVLSQQWLYVRTPAVNWADLAHRPGWLTIHALSTGLDSLQNMSFLARRQQHLTYDASTELEAPTGPGKIEAGLAAFQNQNYWFFLGARRVDHERIQLFLEKRAGKQIQTVATTEISGDAKLIRLKISAQERDYSFYFDTGATGWKALQEHEDGSILSTDVAGGFVGAMVGPYARTE